MKQDKDCMMLNHTVEAQSQVVQSVIVESQVINNRMTYQDRKTIYEKDIPKQNSSEILVQDLTIREKGYEPYWNDVCKEISSKLWLPIKIDSADLDSNLSSSLSKSMVVKSWSSTHIIHPLNQNLPKTYYQSCTSLAAGCMEEGVIRKSKKIRIHLTPNQKRLLKHWFGVSRYVYNKTIEHLKQSDTKANWKGIKTEILNNLPDWSKEVPYQIKSIAIRDACTAVREAKKRTKQGNKSFVKFRSKKDRVQSLYIPKSAITNKGIYYTILGNINYRESLPDVINDSRLILFRNEYYICISTETNVLITDKQGGIIALDPGIRTFMTFYSPEGCGKLAQGDFSRIQRLCNYLDNLISKASKAKAHQRYKLKRAADKIRTKIHNLIKETHHQIANWLTKEYNVILLPTFETQQMALRSARKITSNSVRAMLTWSHYKFQQHLLHKAKERKCYALLVNEAYTSKTVNWTGEIIHNLGGKKVIKSLLTDEWMDRDYNGALGILLKALVDSPSLKVIKSAFVS